MYALEVPSHQNPCLLASRCFSTGVMCWECIIPRILVAWSKERDLTSNGKHCEVFHEEGQRHLLMLKIRFIKVDSSITRFNIACYEEYWKQFCLLFMMGAHGSVGGWKGRG